MKPAIISRKACSRPAEIECATAFDVIAYPPPGSIETMFIKGLGIQAGSEPILPILERSAWGGIRGRMLK